MTRQFLVFADKMFAPSEGFIQNSYKSFDQLQPVFIGSEQRSASPAGTKAITLATLHGILGETGFKQFGLVSDKLKARLAEEKPVLIHAHFGKSGAYALPLARAMGLPLVVTYHGGDATKTANTKNSVTRVYNRRREALWREAALILPVSEFIKGELAAAGCPTDKMTVHYNGADAARFSPGEKSKLILFAGRWVEKKGINTLVDALTLLGNKLNGWRVRLVGDGPLKAALAVKLQSSGVTIELLGWIPATEMPRHFAEAAIACVPSRRAATGDAEGLPTVCVEAMLSGCAIAATRHAGIPECVKDGVTGLLVGEGDSAALAQKLEQLTRDMAATLAMGAAGRELAFQDFNLDRQSAKLQDHLLRIAATAR
ncbi:MAG: glycosyltransferase [Hyphomonadaceae bacterium]|nr:glycosyltransferase [Hyphomonadaceae bacterium]